MENDNSSTKLNKDAFVKAICEITAQQIATMAVRQALQSEELKPEIGFYKRCRSHGIFLHRRYGGII